MLSKTRTKANGVGARSARPCLAVGPTSLLCILALACASAREIHPTEKPMPSPLSFSREELRDWVGRHDFVDTQRGCFIAEPGASTGWNYVCGRFRVHFTLETDTSAYREVAARVDAHVIDLVTDTNGYPYIRVDLPKGTDKESLLILLSDPRVRFIVPSRIITMPDPWQ